MRQVLGRNSGYVMEPFARTEPITVPSADGTPLEGALLASAAEAVRGVVVFCHPLLKYGYHYFLRSGLAAWGAEAGFHGVLFNFKGVGRSPFGGPSFADDVAGAVSFAHRRFPGLPVHLVGYSFGGYHAAHALVRLDGKIASAVFDSVPPRIETFFRSGPAALLMNGVSRSRWAAVTGTAPIAQGLARAGRTPLLLISGDADEYCPIEEVRGLADALPTAQLLLLPGAGHLRGFRDHRGDYTRAVREWWRMSVDAQTSA
jgi:pimeloyl-ACP methyl ester carboxylesterase